MRILRNVLFRALDPEILTNITQNIFGENVDSETVYICFWGTNSVKLLVCAFIEGYTEGSQDRTHGEKYVRVRA